MTVVVILLTLALLFMVAFNVFTVHIFLKQVKVIPESEPKQKTVEDPNDFGEEKYMDLSEITPEMGVKSLTRK